MDYAGVILFVIGMSAYDSNPPIAILMMVVGGLMTYPSIKRFEREEEIRKRREKARRNRHSERAM